MNGYYDRPLSDLEPMLGPDHARRVKCLHNEAQVYRTAICHLLSQAMDGGRKTIDKAEIVELLGHAHAEGNAWHRKGKGQ